jgi:hypothetical protein
MEVDMATTLQRTRPPQQTTGSVGGRESDAGSGVALARWLLAALLVGAGAVHVAMAPSHFGESTAEGIGFLLTAWVQIGLGVAIMLRPSRLLCAGALAVSAAAVAAWV